MSEQVIQKQEEEYQPCDVVAVLRILVRRRRLLFFMFESSEADQGRQNIKRVVTEIRQQWQHHSPLGPVRRHRPFQALG